MTTYASLLTGTTRGAVATIAVQGQSAQSILNAAFTTAGPGQVGPDQVRYGTWHGGKLHQNAGESVVVSRSADLDFDASVKRRWEVHCHGGQAAAQRILDDLVQLGATVVSQQEWLKIDCHSWIVASSVEHADSNASTSPSRLIAEALDVLVRTPSQSTAGMVMDQVRGAMDRFVTDWIYRLTALIPHTPSLDKAPVACHNQELASDVGKLVNEPRIAVALKSEVAESLALHVESILKFADLGLHLIEPWRVVLAGPPNVGKSSLINAILGYQRSITVDQPGTTRDVLEAHTVIEGWPIRLSDTAGIRNNTLCDIEAAGIESAIAELDTADLIVWVQDATKDIQAQSPAFLNTRSGRVIEVVNKCDQVIDTFHGERIRFTSAVDERPARLMTSAITGIGIDELRLQIVKVLIPELPEKASPVPITRRQVDLLRALTTTTDVASLLRNLSELYRDSVAVEEKVTELDGRNGPPGASHHRGPAPVAKTQITTSRGIGYG